MRSGRPLLVPAMPGSTDIGTRAEGDMFGGQAYGRGRRIRERTGLTLIMTIIVRAGPTTKAIGIVDSAHPLDRSLTEGRASVV